MPSFHSPPRNWVPLTSSYALLWLIALLLWRVGDLLPNWLLGIVFTLSIPVGMAWWRWVRAASQRNQRRVAIVGSLIYPAWWHWSVFAADFVGLREVAASLVSVGTLAFFFIGLGWVIWLVERASRRIELKRIDQALQAGPLVSPHEAEHKAPLQRAWNPLDPQAWYYGRSSRKLKQSTFALLTYALLFFISAMLTSRIGGCQQVYELPAGGGKQQAIAQTVKIQKVIRKKFVVNPFSSIKFEVPPIDDVKLKLQEVTAHQYTIGFGEGTGAGFAGGTAKGKIRLFRLEYDGGDWDLNFGIGGDNNMLIEYFSFFSQQKVADKTESLRISQLAAKIPALVFLTGQKSLSVSNPEAKMLREYLLDKHGMLFASSGSNHFHNQFLALMNRVLPEVRPVSVPLDDIIHKVPFSVPTLPYVVPHGGKEALGWSIDGRWLVYYHPGDISDAWADGHAGVSSDVYQGCYQLGANVINYGHAEYSKWLTTKGQPK